MACGGLYIGGKATLTNTSIYANKARVCRFLELSSCANLALTHTHSSWQFGALAQQH